MFVRECDKPLAGVFAIFTLTRVLDLNELSDIAFLIELHDVHVNPSRPGLFMSVHSKKELAPAPGGNMYQGPKGLLLEAHPTPGMRWDVWSFPPVGGKVISSSFINGYIALDRIETGAALRNLSPFSTLGDLDGSLIQIFGSSKITRLVKSFRLVANDFIIYSLEYKDLAWLPVSLDRMVTTGPVPEDLKAYRWLNVQAPPNYLNLSFPDIAVKRHRILNKGLIKDGSLGGTVLPGELGWLPKAEQ